MKRHFILLAIVMFLLFGTASAFGQKISDEALKHFNFGTAANEMSDYPAAIKEFEQAVKLAPDWPEALYNLAFVQEKVGNIVDALANYRECLRLTPDDVDAKSRVNELEYKLGLIPENTESTLKGSTTPLHEAAKNGNMERAKRLIAEGADVTARDHFGRTPLALVYIHDQREMAELLIAHGADLDAQDVMGGTPRGYAELGKSEGIKGKEPERKEAVDVNARDKDGNTSLHWQVRLCQDHDVDLRMKIIRDLIAQGADVNAKENNGHTPLDFVASSTFLKRGWIDLAELLITKGADPNSTLVVAAANNNKDLADYLLAKGANINTSNEKGCTPLNAALGFTFTDCREVAEFLIAKGADINAKDDIGNSPLQNVVMNGEYKGIAELLINKGAVLNARNKWGNTPLHTAASFNRMEMAGILIAHGADMNVKNNEGLTPLQVAENQASRDVVELLRKHGAK